MNAASAAARPLHGRRRRPLDSAVAVADLQDVTWRASATILCVAAVAAVGYARPVVAAMPRCWCRSLQLPRSP